MKKTNYYIETVTDNKDFALYYQVVRRRDEAILYANETLENVFLHCWAMDIKYNDVVLL